MIRVTMTDKSVRVYNEGNYHLAEAGWLKIGSAKPVDENAVAKIRESLVDMIEFDEPCQIIIIPRRRKRAKA